MIGKTLKTIRENKGLSQRRFSENIVSPSFYSKVESGESQISANLLFEILDNVNVTIQEFYFIKKSYKNERQVNIFKQIRLHVIKADISSLECLYKKLEQANEDEIYLCLIKNLKNYINDNEFEQDSINHLKEYLFQVPSWGHYEFQIFSLCTYIFDTETSLLLFNNLVSEFHNS